LRTYGKELCHGWRQSQNVLLIHATVNRVRDERPSLALDGTQQKYEG
jgi:hypothetical protein